MIEKNDSCKGKNGQRVSRRDAENRRKKERLIPALEISQREDEGGRKKKGISGPIRRGPREIREGGRQSEGKGAQGMRKIGDVGEV